MSLSVSNILQRNYITSGGNQKKVNFSLQYSFGLQPADSLTLSKKELNEAEQKQFDEILQKLPPEKTKELENLRTCGILTNKKSNDRTSTLDNLYNILTTERAEGLDRIEIISETIGHLNNPYLISQKSDNSITNYLEAFFSPKTPLYGKRDSSTCTAACIEFDLASLEPAEFTRFVEGLTSKDMKVEKVIDSDNLADKTLDAIWLLNTFDIPREEKDFDKIKLTLKPDENALLKVRLNSKMPSGIKQRNNIDTLMQSTFMHIGSQQSYNSLTDKRGGKFHVTERGLIEFEKTFVESIVRNKNIISVNYQRINEYGEIAGYEADFDTIKQQLLDTLALKENVILGVTNKTKSGKLKGHEIVVTGTRTGTNGKTEFLCFNSDIDKTNPVAYSEDYLLPRIHHAGIPKEIVMKSMVFQDGWIMGLENYKKEKRLSN
ncbi:MAG: hypothetical protein NC390_08160 [Fusobacterium sp.]|nr:hypothetical protein [Fusobacterium sp.]